MSENEVRVGPQALTSPCPLSDPPKQMAHFDLFK